MSQNSQPAYPTQTPPPPANGEAATGAASLQAAELLLHLSRLVHGGQQDDKTQALTPAQWTALRYFARANRLSRTPSAFSEFHATTRGTASQVVKSLIAMGLLERRANQADGRSALIEVTPAGHERLRHDPLAALGAAIDALDPQTRQSFTRSLSQIGVTLARHRRAPVFGKCADCGHCDRSQPDAPWCRCMQDGLDGREMDALCVDFSPATSRS
ncbi:MAG: winged helix-turn-helix transcriptional regulator [Pararhodobacter sp.]|nr:winged helix-turn-helix transcriptional regulator [Pararhodobacter sp.]